LLELAVQFFVHFPLVGRCSRFSFLRHGATPLGRCLSPL
jgi:hypothetical protein